MVADLSLERDKAKEELAKFYKANASTAKLALMANQLADLTKERDDAVLAAEYDGGR